MEELGKEQMQTKRSIRQALLKASKRFLARASPKRKRRRFQSTRVDAASKRRREKPSNVKRHVVYENKMTGLRKKNGKRSERKRKKKRSPHYDDSPKMPSNKRENLAPTTTWKIPTMRMMKIM
jgi:hypothetical protein